MSNSDNRFDYEAYTASKNELRKLIENDFAEVIALVNKCDHLILDSTEDLGSTEPLTAAVHAHSLFVAAYDLARAGHFSALFPLFRTAMESAIYGYLFNREEGLVEKWRNRHTSDADFNTSKQAFTAAIKRFRGYIQEHDANSNDTPYEQHIFSLYDAAIDFGAHPNPIALTNNTSVVAEPEQLKVSYEYLRRNKKGILQGLYACIDYALAIAEINHLSRMLVNPELPGLDATFLATFNEYKALSDKLNGQPIGFDNRYYKRINPFVRKPSDE
ncbi:hypothetical protein ACSPX5_27225 [Pseudomonas sp. HLG18]|uniref:hypothetical protein n=1 Tax=Pseudomonas sp. HLG18 TaxID=3449277 RepID=UPI003F74A220